VLSVFSCCQLNLCPFDILHFPIEVGAFTEVERE